jgi:hypothetical protein
MVVEHADRILSWHENRQPDAIPPQWMWHLDHEVADFFKRTDAKDASGDDADMVDNDAMPAWAKQ